MTTSKKFLGHGLQTLKDAVSLTDDEVWEILDAGNYMQITTMCSAIQVTRESQAEMWKPKTVLTLTVQDFNTISDACERLREIVQEMQDKFPEIDEDTEENSEAKAELLELAKKIAGE